MNDLRVLVELVAMVLAFSRLRSQISLTALFHLNGSYKFAYEEHGFEYFIFVILLNTDYNLQ